MGERGKGWAARVALLGAWLLALLRVLPDPRGHVVSVPGLLPVDLVLHLWQNWWAGRALRGEVPLLHTRMLTWPVELDLSSLWGGHLDLLVSLPALLAGKPVLAANLALAVFLLALLLGTHALLAPRTGDWPAAGAAVALLVSPVFLLETLNGRVEELSIGFLALFLLALGRWLEAGGGRRALLAVLALLLAVLAYIGNLVFLVLLLPALALGYLPSSTAAQRHRAVLAVLGIGVFSLLLVLVVAPHLLQRWLLPSTRPQDWEEWVRMGELSSLTIADLFSGPFVPGESWGSGLVLPLLALFALLPAARGGLRRLPWFLAVLLFHFLALGPRLQLLSGQEGLPSPYLLLPRLFPPFLRYYWPSRFLLVGDLCLAALGAEGLRRLGLLLGRLSARGAVPASLAALLAVFQVARDFPLPVEEVRPPPPVYRWLAGQDGALLELDSECEPLYDPYLAQTYHGRPLCCLDLPGSLRPTELAEHRAVVGAISLAGWKGGWLDPGGLEADGFRYVVLHLPRASPGKAGRPRPLERARTMLRTCCGEPVRTEEVDGGEIMVFALPGTASHGGGE